jgi:hypothetical protein
VYLIQLKPCDQLASVFGTRPAQPQANINAAGL